MTAEKYYNTKVGDERSLNTEGSPLMIRKSYASMCLVTRDQSNED